MAGRPPAGQPPNQVRLDVTDVGGVPQDGGLVSGQPGELVDGGGGVRRLAGQLVNACRAEFCDLFVGAAVEP